MNKKTLCTLVHVWNCCRDMRHVFFSCWDQLIPQHISRLWDFEEVISEAYGRAAWLHFSTYGKTTSCDPRQISCIVEILAQRNYLSRQLPHMSQTSTCLDCGLWQWLSKQWDISITQLLLGAQTTDTWYLPSSGLFVVIDTTLCFDADAMKCLLPPSCKSSLLYRTDEVSC